MPVHKPYTPRARITPESVAGAVNVVWAADRRPAVISDIARLLFVTRSDRLLKVIRAAETDGLIVSDPIRDGRGNPVMAFRPPNENPSEREFLLRLAVLLLNDAPTEFVRDFVIERSGAVPPSA